MKVEAYLQFDGRCEEALDFYRQALGAEVTMMMRFKEAPDQTGITPGSENKIMHSSFKVGESTIMASDGNCRNETKYEGFGLTISVPDVATAEKLFTALGAGGQVQMPLTKTFFSPAFGMVADKFGVSWMILACVPQEGACA